MNVNKFWFLVIFEIDFFIMRILKTVTIWQFSKNCVDLKCFFQWTVFIEINDYYLFSSVNDVYSLNGFLNRLIKSEKRLFSWEFEQLS